MQDTNTTTTPAPAPPQAMLVSLTFKFGRQGGQDDDLTEELCESHGASNEDVKGTKRTICKEAFEPLKKLANEFGAVIKRVTFPWGDVKGMYFCKPAAVAKVVAARDEYGPQFDQLKEEHLLANYEQWKEMTKNKLKGAYKESEFPTKESLAKVVTWNMRILPMPESEVLRKIKDIDENLMAELVKSNDARIQQGVRQGMLTAYQRLMQPLQHMVDKLTDDSPKIYESMLENIGKVVEEIPSLNLTDDPALSVFADRAKALLKTVTTEQLRGDKPEVKVLRKKVAQETMEILANFGQTGVRRFSL